MTTTITAAAALEYLHNHPEWLPDRFGKVTFTRKTDGVQLTLKTGSKTIILGTFDSHPERDVSYVVNNAQGDLVAQGGFRLLETDSMINACEQISNTFLYGHRNCSPARAYGPQVLQVDARAIAAGIAHVVDEPFDIEESSAEKMVIRFRAGETGGVRLAGAFDGVRLTVFADNDHEVPWYAYALTPAEGEGPNLYRAGTIATTGELEGIFGNDDLPGELELILEAAEEARYGDSAPAAWLHDASVQAVALYRI